MKNSGNEAVAASTVHESEQSPFERPSSTPGSRRRRAALFAVVLAATLAVVFLLTREGGRKEEGGGHNHGAAPAAESAQAVMLSDGDARRIGVTFARATVGPLERQVRTVAQVTYDETHIHAISPKIDGWVDRLFVDFTGKSVRAGEPLLTIYSPMVVTAQQELLLAKDLERDVATGTPDAVGGAGALVAAARRRLQYWDIPQETIDRLEQTGEVQKTITLRAPVSGVIVEKSVLAGQRIMAGDALYRVVDLSTVWLEGEVFEQDAASVRLGQEVRAEFQALRGEERGGRITYVYPTLNAETRTTRVRVELPNPGLRLKPGMYATFRFTAAMGSSVLNVPRSAVLVTGERNLVFVPRPDGRFVPRDVKLGMASDDHVQILSGLAPGDSVVASATFLVDAESNLGSALGGMGDMPGMDVTAPTPGRDSPARPAAKVAPK